MLQYLSRRLIIAIPSLLGISVILFTVLALAPGDPFEELATNPAIPPDVRAHLRASLGLDDPVYLRYFSWLTAMLRGDWGYSFVSRIPVDQLILQRLPSTIAVIGLSQVLALAIAMPVGVYAATKPYSVFDQVANTLAFIGFSLPTFFIGLLLLTFVAIKMKLVEIPRFVPLTEDPLAWAQSLTLPAITLAMVFAASYVRLTRAYMLETMSEDYIRTARAKGVKESVVIRKHGLRAALTPIVTAAGMDLGGLLGGAVITEQVFGFRGLGYTAVRAIDTTDLPVIVGIVIVASTFVVIANLVVDILYGVIDPRVRLT